MGDPVLLASELVLLVGHREYDISTFAALRFCKQVLSKIFPDIPGTFSGTGRYATSLKAASRKELLCNLSLMRSRYLDITISAILSVVSDPGFSKLVVSRTTGTHLLKDTSLLAFAEHHLLSAREQKSHGHDSSELTQQHHHCTFEGSVIAKDLSRTAESLEAALRRDKRFKALADNSNTGHSNTERIPFALVLLVNDYAHIILLRRLITLKKLVLTSNSSMPIYFQLIECLGDELSVIAAIANGKHTWDSQAELEWQMPSTLHTGLKRFEIDQINKDIYQSAYTYDNMIRLMCIEPADDLAPLETWLIDHNLSKKPEGNHHLKRGLLHTSTYDAISYAWAVSMPAFTKVKVDGCKYIIVAKHVVAALRLLRRRYEPTYVWLDCVCINQADHSERGQQVRLMKGVFTEARKVVIWLGGNTINPTGTSVGSTSDTIRHALLADNQWSWWRRLWVVQEFAVARELEVAFDGVTITWAEFVSCCTAQEVLESADSLRGAVDAVLALTKIKNKFWKAPVGFKLFQLLRLTSTSNSTHPLDRIFALQGLVSDSCYPDLVRHQLLPDYTKQKDLLFLQVALHILDVEDSLDVLVWRWRSLSSLGLTWVPDYTTLLPWKVALCDFDYSASANCRPIWSVGGEHVQSGIVEGGLTQTDAVNTWFQSKQPANKPLTLSLAAIELDVVYRAWPGAYSKGNHLRTAYNFAEHHNTIPSLVAAFSAALMETLGRSFPDNDPRSTLSSCEDLPCSASQANLLVESGFDLATLFNCWRNICNTEVDVETALQSPLDRMLLEFQRLSPSLNEVLDGRAAFSTSHGLVGFGPCDAKPGDIVIVALGASVPFVLRPTKQGFKLIGDAYIDGIMHGELLRLSEEHPDKIKLKMYGLI